jgi:GT2 family glycosyltransferase
VPITLLRWTVPQATLRRWWGHRSLAWQREQRLAAPPNPADGNATPRVAILIPAHNRRALTVACADAVAPEAGKLGLAVVLMDDGSNDGTADAIMARHPDVIVRRGPGDWYWTGAIAAGMTWAREQGFDHIIWLNDDCRPRPGCLQALVDFVQRFPDAIGAAACLAAEPGAHWLDTGFVGRKRIKPWPGQIRWVEGCSGFCVIVSGQVWSSVGSPDVRHFPHYLADSAYCLKARRLGFRVALVGQAEVVLMTAPGQDERWQRNAVRPATWCEAWRATFLERGSAWRLATHWHYLRLKYNPGLAELLFVGRVLQGHAKWLRARLTR